MYQEPWKYPHPPFAPGVPNFKFKITQDGSKVDSQYVRILIGTLFVAGKIRSNETFSNKGMVSKLLFIHMKREQRSYCQRLFNCQKIIMILQVKTTQKTALVHLTLILCKIICSCTQTCVPLRQQGPLRFYKSSQHRHHDVHCFWARLYIPFKTLKKKCLKQVSWTRTN